MFVVPFVPVMTTESPFALSLKSTCAAPAARSLSAMKRENPFPAMKLNAGKCVICGVAGSLLNHKPASATGSVLVL